MRSVELFVGAGGLGMGIAQAGFHHEAAIEWDQDACETIRENQSRGVRVVSGWKLHHADVRQFDYSVVPADVDLVAGGPPCQPFSLGGKHRGHLDERNMFPEMVRAVRELRPRAFLVENVRGLVRHSFAAYFEYIYLQLSYPEVARKDGEEWRDHAARLERHHTEGAERGLTYNVVFRVLNAADYGVPQRRDRVLLVGFRGDLGIRWSFPEATHSLDSLLWSQWVTGDYWERHEVAASARPECPPRLLPRVGNLKASLFPPEHRPWATLRDALAGLPDPESDPLSRLVANHQANPGARSYPGHTGSPLDEPSKTLKAGDHGVPGGENTVVLPDGRVRYLTVRESARVQTFPDEYVFRGSWTEAMRQLGNAVPVELAQVVASSVAARLEGSPVA